jgi:DNA polymerase III delta subunit
MAQLYTMPDEDQITFIHVAQEVEMLGLLVADGSIDLELVERTLGDFVVRAWEKYRPVIEDMRKQLSDPYLAEYFQHLAERLARLMRDAPRTPAMAA